MPLFEDCKTPWIDKEGGIRQMAENLSDSVRQPIYFCYLPNGSSILLHSI